VEGSCEYLNKQSRTADKGGPPAWGLGEVLTAPHRKKYNVAKQSKSKPRTWTDTVLAQDRDTLRALVNAVMNLRV